MGFKKCRQLGQGFGSVAEAVFCRLAKFREALRVAGWNEKRVVSKTSVSGCRFANSPSADAFEKLCFLRLGERDQRENTAELSGATFFGNSVQLAQ